MWVITQDGKALDEQYHSEATARDRAMTLARQAAAAQVPVFAQRADVEASAPRECCCLLEDEARRVAVCRLERVRGWLSTSVETAPETVFQWEERLCAAPAPPAPIAEAALAKLHVARFRPSESIKGVCLIIGPAQSGKTVLLRDLLRRSGSTQGLLCASVAPSACPLPWAPALSAEAAALRDAFVGVDDCTVDWQSEHVASLCLNARARGVLACFASQAVPPLPPAIWQNVDYVIVRRTLSDADTKALHAQCFGALSLGDFCHILAECTRDYACLVLDRTRGDVRKGLFWYRAKL